jgi:hypothetical protein
MQQTPERIQHLWNRLATIGGFTYESRPGPRSLTGWQGEGRGQVQIDDSNADGLWKSAQDHVCINDLYSGELRESANGFELTWHITGPKKDEHLFYRYFPDNS